MTDPTKEYHPHPKDPKVELRILKVTRKGLDPIADGWDGHAVHVVGWFPAWTGAGFVTNSQPLEGLSRIHWSAKILEIPDRLIHESELLRIM